MNNDSFKKTGQEIYDLVKKLYPICRSLTGDGVRQTLSIIKQLVPQLSIHEIPSGTVCYDWIVPKEWNIRDAYILDPSGNKIANFKENNLHVVGYSVPVDMEISLKDLQEHLYSLPEQPDAIPYVTSYYQERWGFCLSHKERDKLTEGKYRVKIDSDLKDGNLTYGEILIPGDTKQEIFLSTYICHPSMANNELSGPCVTTFLARFLLSLKNRRYSYRIVFIPETIGSIAYISKYLRELQKLVIAGFVITCVGDDRAYSYLPSKYGDTISDQVALHVLKHIDPKFIKYTFLDRGSDERQYCSPGVDLPMASIMRSKYGSYPEYHTSLDDLNFVTANGLAGGFKALYLALQAIEKNEIPKITVLCEPQLGKRGLYPTLSTKENKGQVSKMMDLITYSDGKNSLLDIADIISVPIWELYSIYDKLIDIGLLKSNITRV